MQGFELVREGLPVDLPLTAQRVLAFLAVAGRPLLRDYVAGVLWPDASDARANGSLRSALWRLHRSAPETVIASGARLALSSRLTVDFHEALQRAHNVLGSRHSLTDGAVLAEPADFAFELLPDWYDEWLIGERERLRQLQLHALEAMSARLRHDASYGQAVEAAQLAVAFEPTRESARRALIEAHLAEGNRAAAIREFLHFRDLLERELGVEPSPRLRALLPQPFGAGRYS
jgi:DNA-binding SARP family transcriptional activator